MIGSRVAKLAAERGYYPIIIDNLFNGRIENLSGLKKNQFKLIIADINQPNLERKLNAQRPIAAVVHCAAIHYIPYCQEHPQQTIDTNVFGTLKMLRLASKLKIKKFVMASSAATYRPKLGKCLETDPLEAVDIYGQTKIIDELLVQSEGEKNKINYSILRFFNVYGKNNLTPHIIPSIVKQIKTADTIYLGNLTACRDYIFVDDVAALIMLAIKDKTNGVYNVGTSQATSVKSLVEKIIAASGKKITVKQKKELFRKNDRPYLVADTTKTKKHFHWSAVASLKDGLNQVIN